MTTSRTAAEREVEEARTMAIAAVRMKFKAPAVGDLYATITAPTFAEDDNVAAIVLMLALLSVAISLEERHRRGLARVLFEGMTGPSREALEKIAMEMGLELYPEGAHVS